MINWQFFPKSRIIPEHLQNVLRVFESDYLVIALRKDYRGNPDFQNVITFFDTLYALGRLQLPLKEILIICY